MTDIVAANVSARILRRSMVNPASSESEAGSPWVVVDADILIDVSTNADVPAGGIPLTNLFTSGATGDTGIDPAQEVFSTGLVSMVADSAETTRVICEFLHTGATAATQILAVYEIPADGGTNPEPLTPSTGTLSDDAFLGDTTAFTTATVRVQLTGRLRADVDVTSI